MHDYDGADNDMGFTLVGEWKTMKDPIEAIKRSMRYRKLAQSKASTRTT